ncbi:MAG: hypothetical protein NTY11_02805, partial [Candidatus Parcubacteria bacterium]|nr:hypothetical protein [Candidatus Parcubacteria bacterium]
MKYKKFRLILIALLVIVTVSVTILGLIGYNVVSAATEDGSDNTPAIVQKLADRFNLNPQEVQAVFTENRMDLKTEREQKFVDKLN